MNDLFSQVFTLERAAKQARLLDELKQLDQHHLTACAEYRSMCEAGAIPVAAAAERLDELPYLPVRLFKLLELSSVPRADIFKVLSSSGTSSQVPSRVVLDRATAQAQTRALVAIMKSWLGPERLPMLIVDSPEVAKPGASMTARTAGVIGFSALGRDHAYALDEQLAVAWDKVDAFLAAHGGKPFLVFGFTYIVWQHLYKAAQAAGRKLDLSQALLLHGGGWKKLQAEQVDAAELKARLHGQFGVARVHSYYGMVEQVGSIFVECEAARLHTPAFADVVVRDPVTLAPLPLGAAGLLQVLSVLPRSYPGHSLLTEDLGQCLGEDDCPCGRAGRTFHVQGRLPAAELRGCSDTRVT
jgi:hypothetical protein